MTASPKTSPEALGASLDDILSRYDVLLFDAYGVLVHADGALPGAAVQTKAPRRAEARNCGPNSQPGNFAQEVLHSDAAGRARSVRH